MSEAEFERWLGRSLEQELGPLLASATPPPPAYATPRRLASLFKPLRSRVVLGFAAASLATLTGGAVAATAVTGSSDPSAWGQQVEAVVSQCKTARAPGERGIGHCVSAAASQKSQAPGDQHASAAREAAPPPAAGRDSQAGEAAASSKDAAKNRTAEPETSGQDQPSHAPDDRAAGDPSPGSGHGRPGD
ncbi:MAG: hypothetical protein E6J02_01110 [Chloroflexi bacterium]|nr:MAG: hypothetical protein E6J02_01110 [Chloroflexota bacterium]